jgi:beta-aspartyl-peptidase (threonine type)
LDAAEAAVRVLEDDPVFNAGASGVRNAAGILETDAAIMDGNTLALGGVAAAPGLVNPILVARAMLDEPPTLLSGHGVRIFSEARGLGNFGGDLVLGPRALTGGDTVGCVARDQSGRIAAAVSTGGLTGKAPGRIGDSPLPGCGLYADSEVGGVSLSGDGEAICRTILAARAIVALEQGSSIQNAVESSLSRLGRTGGEAGMIAIDREGRIGWAHRGAQFAVAWADACSPAPQAALHQDDRDA